MIVCICTRLLTILVWLYVWKCSHTYWYCQALVSHHTSEFQLYLLTPYVWAKVDNTKSYCFQKRDFFMHLRDNQFTHYFSWMFSMLVLNVLYLSLCTSFFSYTGLQSFVVTFKFYGSIYWDFKQCSDDYL